MRAKQLHLLFFLTTLLAAVQTSSAQSATVIGRDSFAVECYRVSQIVATSKNTNRAALVSCDRAIKEGQLGPKDLVATYVNRRVVYMAMAKPVLALKDLNRALALDQDTGEAYVNRGNLWFLAQQLPNAITDYDLTLKQGIKQTHVAYLNRGIAREGLGHFEQAKQDYIAALGLIEDWPEASKRLIRVEERIRKQRKANATEPRI